MADTFGGPHRRPDHSGIGRNQRELGERASFDCAPRAGCRLPPRPARVRSPLGRADPRRPRHRGDRMIATGSDEYSTVLAERIGQFIIDADKNAGRSQQKAIGPSEVGEPCERQLSYKMLDWPESNDSRDPIAAIIGTGFHMWMAAQFEARQTVMADGTPGTASKNASPCATARSRRRASAAAPTCTTGSPS